MEMRIGRHATRPAEVAEPHGQHLGRGALARAERERHGLGAHPHAAGPARGAGRADLLDAEMIGVGELGAEDGEVPGETDHAVSLVEQDRVERDGSGAPGAQAQDVAAPPEELVEPRRRLRRDEILERSSRGSASRRGRPAAASTRS